jgi:hypothetical protein
MRLTKIKLFIIGLLLISSVSALAWWANPGSDVILGITRVTTSETHIGASFPSAYDLGDTDPSITNRYGGQIFSFGSPMQIEVIIANAPTADTWDTITLQYIAGTDSGAGAWTTIGTITNGFDSITEIAGCHFGLSWTPPAAGNYLVRIHGLTTGAAQNALLSAQNITKDGDGFDWDDYEVVGFNVTGNTRPGY